MPLPKISLESLGIAPPTAVGLMVKPPTESPRVKLPPGVSMPALLSIQPPTAAHKVTLTPVEIEKSLQPEVKPMSVPGCSEKTQLRTSSEQMSGAKIVSADPAKGSDWSVHLPTVHSKDDLLTCVTDDCHTTKQLDRGYLYYPDKDTHLAWLMRVNREYPAFALTLVRYHRVVLSPRAVAQLRLLSYPAGCLVDAGTGQEGPKGANLWSEVIGERHRRFEELS